MRAWQSGGTTAVVLPHRSLAVYFRAQLLERGIPLLGIHFLSPAQLRMHLFRDEPVHLPSREHLRLLLSIAAEQDGDEDARVAQAIARAPDHLLHAIDQLGAAGWDFAASASPELREIVGRFERSVRRSGFTFLHEVDRTAMPSSPHFRAMLISGFDGGHWTHWPLLLAATKASQRATVVLSHPREEARDLDATWIGSWEEEFGAAVPIDDADDQLSLFEGQRGANPDFQFVVGRDTTEQAAAVAALTQQFLADPRCTRIGVLFPEAGALPRLVAAALARARIAHHDSIAHFAAGPFAGEAWAAWLELQSRQRLKCVLAFLRAQPNALLDFTGLTSDRVENILRRALDEILIDDLDVLRKFCAGRTDHADAIAVANGLAKLRILPAAATLPEFLRQTHEIFEELEWTERWTEIQRLTADWSGTIDVPFTREIYLRWLSEISLSFALVRDEVGDHPYSRVQLLPYAHAVDQRWSHLIFCGLNEGSWPPRGSSAAFVGDEVLAELNAGARVLNRRATQQGNQGEGHSAVAKGKALCLGANEEREIAARQFSALLEAVEIGVGVAATLFHESSPSRISNPSEFFTRLYFTARGHALSQATFAVLQEETQRWLGGKGAKTQAGSDIQQTRVAYDRRRALTAAGEYDFALREPPVNRVRIAATSWEYAIKNPALVWMKAFLGVEPEDEDERSALATGQWVHRWLGAISGPQSAGDLAAIPAAPELRRIVRDGAQSFRAKVIALLESCGRATPDWWLSGWTNAAYLADCLAAKLARVSGWTELATERRLDPAAIKFGDGAELSFSGRADLILSRGGGRDLWVVDYKTGTKKTLRPSRCHSDRQLSEKLGKKLRGGEGIQLALYALALREGGAENVAVSLLSPNLSLDRPQLRVDDFAAQNEFWRELARMQATGIFGMRGEIRSDFTFSGAYPLATLPLEPELLEAKWTLTHPAFTKRKEEPEE